MIFEKLSQRPLFQKIVENSGWQIGDRAVRLGLNFFITAWIARYLGPESYGKLSYVIAVVSIFQVFSSLGIEWIILKEFSAGRGSGDSGGQSLADGSTQGDLGTAKVVTTIKLKFLSGLLGQALLLGTLKIIGGESSIAVMATAQSFLLLLGSFDTIDYWFQSRMEVRRVVIIRSLGFFAASALRLFLLLGNYPLETFTLPFLMESVVGNILIFKLYREKVGDLGAFLPAFEVVWLKDLLKKLPVLFVTAVMLQMYLRIDQVLLQWLSGSEAVGIFSISVRLSEIFYMVGSAVIASAAPALFSAHKLDPPAFRSRMERLFRTLNGVSVGICLFIGLIAEPLVTVVFGEKYAASVEVLRIYIWCLPPVLQGGIRNVWLMAEGRTVFALFAATLGTLISLILNITLIPLYGVKGAAIAAVIAMWTSGIFSSFLQRELKEIASLQLLSFLPWRKV
ncbi:MAG: flippase [Bdellovibrionales bacterium]|nr:flippase [Bdellovibrionales bacterium]